MRKWFDPPGCALEHNTGTPWGDLPHVLGSVLRDGDFTPSAIDKR
jgi:hypothetical protein